MSVLNRAMARTNTRQKERIYISGGITRCKDYKEKFKEAHLYLLGRYDCIVVNPVHLSTRVENSMPFPLWHDYMRECIHWLPRCSKVYMLNGWWKSRGAKIEWLLAKLLKIEVMYQGRNYGLRVSR